MSIWDLSGASLKYYASSLAQIKNIQITIIDIFSEDVI